MRDAIRFDGVDQVEAMYSQNTLITTFVPFILRFHYTACSPSPYQRYSKET